MNNKKDVEKKFNENAEKYDSQRRQLIPCFDDFYTIAATVARTNKKSPNILDLGAGTGLLSSKIVERYPDARLTLIDLSDKMLEVAKERLQEYENITYIVNDYTKHAYTSKFDIIVSSLSIHHLSDEEKKKLYQDVYKMTDKGGCFINADQVLGSSPFLEALYVEDWKSKVERSGLSTEEIKESYERLKLDQMSTLSDQLQWLEEAGFSDVDCLYKYYNFVVLFGRKTRA
ncbi:class I SAM-dependent methyltransferase [Heliorestis convoluta]|uniref:Methyltransferase n=1 Tax=Heliorestis convoluta TaxID=356322 RepID=A0A5Q2N343_9FIRM|nr:class I SAM-dependent methyltransferase [Heliorestis convoluta]QGG46750.1 methyltransferase [Heliorestis convoluta]